jgi:hypothetical protein
MHRAGATWPTEALLAMDRWLTAVERDHSNISRARKIADDRPANLQDRCTADICKQEAATRYGTPHSVAGGDELNDIVKCRLQPLRRDELPVRFTDDEWAQLQKAFPSGVCDWSQPGIGQGRNVPWLTYQDAKGDVIYGGRPMGPPPRSRPLRGGAKLRG